jgi:excisionase family DNA binding protein
LKYEISEDLCLQEYNGMLFSGCRIAAKQKTGKVARHVENLPNILRTRDLAILLDMSPDAVNDLARKGIVKGYKSGNQWRFRRKDIAKYLDREARNQVPPG